MQWHNIRSSQLVVYSVVYKFVIGMQNLIYEEQSQGLFENLQPLHSQDIKPAC